MKKVKYIVFNIFPTTLHTRFLTQSFASHHFTTHIYPSHYTPLSPLPIFLYVRVLNYLDGQGIECLLGEIVYKCPNLPWDLLSHLYNG